MSKRAVIAVIIAGMVGVLAAIMCGYFLPYIGYKLLYVAFAAGHSGDPSVGDSVGWMIVFVWPAALCADLAASVTVGAVAFHIAYRRFTRPARPVDEVPGKISPQSELP